MSENVSQTNEPRKLIDGDRVVAMQVINDEDYGPYVFLATEKGQVFRGHYGQYCFDWIKFPEITEANTNELGAD